MENQRYEPQFGYSSPKRTKEVCNNPAFMDENLHRVGWFALSYDDDGLPGYHLQLRCVNCGVYFKETAFVGAELNPNIKVVGGKSNGK